MITVKRLSKKFCVPTNDLEVLKKLFFIYKTKNFLKKNEFYSLKNINFKIKPGETIFVIGKQGSGKTTLFSVLSDKINYEEGLIIKSGNCFYSTLINLPPNLFPRLELISYIKVILSFYSKNQKLDSNYLIKKIINLLKLSKNQLNSNFYEIEKNIFKLIVLAIACFQNNKIYLFDNFNFNFDNFIFQKIWKKFEYNSKDKIKIIFSCNNIDFIKSNADKVMILDNGIVKKFDFIKNINDKELLNYRFSKSGDDLIEDDEY